MNLREFSREDLVRAIADWIDKATSGENYGIANDIRSGVWLDDLEDDLNG